MALHRNFGVNRRNRLCGIQKYASAQFLDFLELAKNCTFLDRKLISALYETADGHEIGEFNHLAISGAHKYRCNVTMSLSGGGFFHNWSKLSILFKWMPVIFSIS